MARLALAGLLLVLTIPVAGHAQTGTVTGTVVSGRSLAGLADVFVTAGEGLSTVTNADGRFELEGLSGTEVTLQFDLIGYRTQSVTTQVGTVGLRVVMGESAIALDEIVVTGQSIATERRSIGNAVATINAADQQLLTPSLDLSTMLNARAPGVVFQASQGVAGGGGRIRIRGTNSISLNNEPLIYVDGVRVDNETGRGFSWGPTSRLNDIDPNSIESIEVIKGPAAATLYGTEASNGVIQIFTKKGTPGAARFTAFASRGMSKILNVAEKFESTKSYYYLPSGEVSTLNLVQKEEEEGRPLFRTGQTQRYGMEVAGGTDVFRYFVTGSFDSQEGIMEPNVADRWNGRANFEATASENLTIAANAAYVSSSIEVPYHELLRGPFNPSPYQLDTPNRGFLVAPPEALRAAYHQTEDVSRFTSGIRLEHRPTSWLTQRFSVGIDEVNEEANTLVPRLPDSLAVFFGPNAVLGSKTVNTRDRTTTTVDYASTATTDLTASLSSTTSFGVQYFRKYEKVATISGQQFPAPGITTISSAAVQSGTENFVENITLGGFLQQQVGFNDRAYLTVAFRIDDNSAFGRDFEAVVYPKVSGTWVLSEESFWPAGSIGTFRVRGAFGQSGQQPDAFAALRSYQPITGPGGGAAVRPQFVGNPDLGPERGTEVELGFDASALDDRLNLEFTWYDKRARDAIVAKPVAPSSGFIANQFVNLGEIQNTGYEVFLSGLPVETDFLRWNLGVSFARNTNEILHLGIGDEIAGPVNQYHRVGFPVSAYFEKVTVSSSVDPTTGAVIDLMCDAGVDGRQGGPTVPCAEAGRLYIGQVLPEYEGAITSDITLWNRLTISGLLDFKIGQSIFSADLAIQCTILRLCEPNIDPASNPAAAGEMAQFVFGPYVTPETSFAKFRQVAATYHVPASWVSSFGGSGATITASARNLYTFTDYDRSPEPELATVFGGNSVYQPAFNAVPHPFEFLTTVRLSF